MRKVCVLTETRGGYGILKPLMNEIKKSKSLELQLVVSGMHLLERFGNSVNEIEKDGFKIDAKLDIIFDRDSGEAMAKSIAKAIDSYTECFKKIKPDIIVILGDRMEAFAASVSAVCMNIPIAHLHGGDITGGGLDEIFRYNLSKFSNIHFEATKESVDRLKKIGEEDWRIHLVGAPGLDSIYAKTFADKKEVCKHFGLVPENPIILVVQHSVTTESEKAGMQMKETMEAIKELGIQTVVVYPNCDAGGRKIIEIIEQYKKIPFIKIFSNLDHETFLNLMKYTNVMVGNSSSCIIETPLFKLPAVNIGTRQKGRERSTNIIDAGHNKEEIKNAIKKTLFDKVFTTKVKECKNPYGDGKASKRIVKILEDTEINSKLLQKKMI